MTDKQLYNYFKVRQHNFDEMPGDALWNKIETGLHAAPTTATTLPYLKVLLATAITGVIATATILLYNHRTTLPEQKTKEPAVAQPYEAAKADPLQVMVPTDTVKPKKAKAIAPKTKEAIAEIEFHGVVSKPIPSKTAVIADQSFETMAPTEIATEDVNLKPETARLGHGDIHFADTTHSNVTYSYPDREERYMETYYSGDKIYNADQVTVQPEYPDGILAFYNFIKDNIKVTEDFKKDMRMYISYVIEKDGSISNVKVSGDAIITSSAAEKLLKKAKKWRPALIKGKPVRYKYALPFNYRAIK